MDDDRINNEGGDLGNAIKKGAEEVTKDAEAIDHARKAAANLAAGNKAGAVVEGVKAAPRLLKRGAQGVVAMVFIFLIPFVLIGYILNPMQTFYAAGTYWSNVSDTMEAAILEAELDDLESSSGVAAYDYNPFRTVSYGVEGAKAAAYKVFSDAVDGVSSLLSGFSEALSSLFSFSNDSFKEGGDYTNDTETYLHDVEYDDVIEGDDDDIVSLDELGLEEEESGEVDAMTRRINATKNRVYARAREIRTAILMKEGGLWTYVKEIVDAQAQIDSSKVYGTSTKEYSLSAFNISAFTEMASAELLAGYTVQEDTYADEYSSDLDEDGNVELKEMRNEVREMKDYLNWIGYQDDEEFANWIMGRSLFPCDSKPWSGTFLPQTLVAERQYVKNELLAAYEEREQALKNGDFVTFATLTLESLNIYNSLSRYDKSVQDTSGDGNGLATALVNYIVTASKPESVVSYNYYLSDGTEVSEAEAEQMVADANAAEQARYESELSVYNAALETYTGTPDEVMPTAPTPARTFSIEDFVKSTVITIDVINGVNFASDEDIVNILGLWTGGGEGIASGTTTNYDFKSSLADTEKETISTTREQFTNGTYAENNFNFGSSDSDAEIETENEDENSDLDYYNSLSDGDSSTDEDDSLTGEEIETETTTETLDANINPKFDVDALFSNDYYFSKKGFGFTDKIIENMKTALNWGRNDSGQLVSRWTIGTGEAAEIDSEDEVEDGVYVRKEAYQVSFFYDMLRNICNKLGIPGLEDTKGSPDTFVEFAEAELALADSGNEEAKYGYKYQEAGGLSVGNNSSEGDPWCCAFVYYCADQVGYIGGCFGSYTASCAESWSYFSGQGLTHLASSGYVPERGDLIYYKYGGDGINHIGIVQSCDGSSVTTIEGNTKASSNGGKGILSTHTFSLSFASIYGYASPEYPAGSMSLEGADSPQAYFWLYGLEQGYSKQAIAGLMGNIFRECGNCTTSTSGDEKRCKDGSDTWNLESGSLSGNGSYGMCQWLNYNGSPNGRKAKLIKYCKSNGLEVSSIEGQAAFVFYELEGSYKKSVGSAIKTNTNVDSAAKIVFDIYENPGDSTCPNRQAAARGYYERFKDYTSSSLSGSYLEKVAQAAELVANYVKTSCTYGSSKNKWTLEKLKSIKNRSNRTVSCTGYLTIVLKLAGCYDQSASAHLGHSSSTINGLGDVKNATVVHVKSSFKDLPAQYKVAGCTYIARQGKQHGGIYGCVAVSAGGGKYYQIGGHGTFAGSDHNPLSSTNEWVEYVIVPNS